jgi:SAM-dependent methyltransferase
VLDVGCGSSEFLFQYLEIGHKVIGLDRIRSSQYPLSELTSEFVSHWQYLIRFLDGDGTAIPLDNDSVDYLVCLSVLEHIVSREGPELHRKVLSEFRRVLRSGGLLIMTCDTFTNPRVAYGGLPGWGENGWDYVDDIDFLGMHLLDPSQPIRSRCEINADEDTFFVQPDMYLEAGYGKGFELFGDYHRLTSIGYVLVK